MRETSEQPVKHLQCRIIRICICRIGPESDIQLALLDVLFINDFLRIGLFIRRASFKRLQLPFFRFKIRINVFT